MRLVALCARDGVVAVAPVEQQLGRRVVPHDAVHALLALGGRRRGRGSVRVGEGVNPNPNANPDPNPNPNPNQLASSEKRGPNPNPDPDPNPNPKQLASSEKRDAVPKRRMSSSSPAWCRMASQHGRRIAS